jgi:hypothetical protein
VPTRGGSHGLILNEWKKKSDRPVGRPNLRA